MKRLAAYTAIILATLAVLVVLWQFRSIIILLIISLVLSAALRPGFDWLASKGMPASIARLLIFLVIIAGVGLVIYLVSDRFAGELRLLSNYLVIAYENFYRGLERGAGLQQTLASFMPAPDALPDAIGGENGGSVIQLLVGVTQSVVTIGAGLVIIIVISLYWSADRNHFERLWLSALPASQRVEARSIWRTTETTMGAYLRSELIQVILAALFLGIGYTVMGLTYPLLAALLGALAWLIPLAGFVFIAIVSFLFGLISGGWVLAVAALVYTALVLLFLEFVVEPRFFQRRRFSGLLIILSMLILVQAYGLIGFVIAPPLAVALQVAGSHIVRLIQRPRETSLQFEVLEERLAALQEQYNQAPDAESRKEIGSLMDRLAKLVDQARQVVVPVD